MVTHSFLPWSILDEQTEEIPWAGLRALANALGKDEEVLEQLLKRYTKAYMASYKKETYGSLYVPAIIAMGAGQLDPKSRRRAAEFLLGAIDDAGLMGNELQADVLSAAIGSLGAETVLPLVLDAMRDADTDDDTMVDLWDLLALAGECKDSSLYVEVVGMCTETLEQAEADEVDTCDVELAAEVLAELKHEGSADLLKRAYAQTRSPDVLESLKMLEGRSEYPREPHMWEMPVEEWLEENRQMMQEWFEDRGDYPDLDALMLDEDEEDED